MRGVTHALAAVRASPAPALRAATVGCLDTSISGNADGTSIATVSVIGSSTCGASVTAIRGDATSGRSTNTRCPGATRCSRAQCGCRRGIDQPMLERPRLRPVRPRLRLRMQSPRLRSHHPRPLNRRSELRKPRHFPVNGQPEIESRRSLLLVLLAKQERQPLGAGSIHDSNPRADLAIPGRIHRPAGGKGIVRCSVSGLARR